MVEQFDIIKDNQIEDAGGFFCLACCVSKPGSELSPNKKYCVGCYNILKQEAILFSGSKPREPSSKPTRPAPVAKISGTKVKQGKSTPKKKPVIMKQKQRVGRPSKKGKVTRVTKWRREKKLKQGALL